MPETRLERIARKRAERDQRIAAARKRVDDQQVREHAPLLDKVLNVPRMAVRGMAEGALGTRIGWNELTGDKAEADEIRGARDVVREHLGDPLSAAGTTGHIGGRLAYEVGEFAVPGKVLGLASKLMQAAPKATILAKDIPHTLEATRKGGRALAEGLKASERTLARRLGRDALLSSPLDYMKAQGREESTAGALADVTGNETLGKIADSPAGRGALEVAVGAIGNVTGEAIGHGIRRVPKVGAVSRRAARIEEIRARTQTSGAGASPAGSATGSPIITDRISTSDGTQAAPSHSSVQTSEPSVQSRQILDPTLRGERYTEPPAAPVSRVSSVTFTPEFEVGSIDPASNRKVLQPTGDLKTILQLADEALPQMRETLERTAFEVPGVTVFGVRAKHRKASGEENASGIQRIRDKIEQEGQPPHTMSDFLGGRVWVEDGTRPEEVLERLQAKGWEIVKDDGGFKPRGRDGKPAYRGRHVEVRAPNGMTAELQIVPRKVGEVQEVAHLPYNIVRTKRAPKQLLDQLNDAAEELWRLADEAPPHAPIPHARVQEVMGQLPGHSDTPTEEESLAAIEAARKFAAWYRQQTGMDRALAGAQGREDRVLFSDGREMPVRFRVVEASSIQASNLPETFEPNPRYPARVQGRQYHGAAGQSAREHTILETQRLRPLGLLDASVKVSGTPIVTADGTVVAGNQRTMMLQRAGVHAPERAAEYRAMLAERAQIFGIDPAQLDGMKEPVLVRELMPGDGYDLGDPEFLRELNALSDTRGTKAKDAQTDAATRVSTLQANGRALEHFGATLQPEQTLSQYLETPAGRTFVQELAADGAIAPQELARFIDPATQRLTRAGKLMVEDLMYAAAIGSPEVVKTAPARALQQLEHAIPSIARANQLPGFELQAELQGALEVLAARAAMTDDVGRAVDLDEFLAQGDLLGSRWDEAAAAIARVLDGSKKAEVADAFRRYVRAAEEAASQGQADDMFGARPATKEESLARIFGLEPAGAPATGGRPGFIGDAPAIAGSVKVEMEGDAVIASIRGIPKQEELERVYDLVRKNPRGKFLYRLLNDRGETIETGRSLIDLVAGLRSNGPGAGARVPSPQAEFNAADAPRPKSPPVLGQAELGVRMMGSIAGSGAGGAGGYMAGMSTEGTPEERRKRALILATFGAAAGAGLPMVGSAHLRGTARAAATGNPHADDLAAFLAQRRTGAVGDLDLFGNPVDDGADAQASLFGAKEGTAGGRTLRETEAASRAELEKLRQEMELLGTKRIGTGANDVVRRQLTPQQQGRRAKIAARIAELERLVNRGQKISPAEIRTRAQGGEDMFGNRTGAIGAQPKVELTPDQEKRIAAAPAEKRAGMRKFLTEIAQRRANVGAFREKIEAALEKGRMLELGIPGWNPKAKGPGRIALVSKQPGDELGRWRVTTFDEDGPQGHVVYNSLDELAAEVFHEAATFNPGKLDAWATTPRFQKGLAVSQRENAPSLARAGAIGEQPDASPWRVFNKRFAWGEMRDEFPETIALIREAVQRGDARALADKIDQAIAVGAYKPAARAELLAAGDAAIAAAKKGPLPMPAMGERNRAGRALTFRSVEPGISRTSATLRFQTAAGEEIVAKVHRNGDALEVDWIGRPDAVDGDGAWKVRPGEANTIGPRAVRDIIDAIREEFPGVRVLEADRISGVRAGGANRQMRKRVGAIGEQPQTPTQATPVVSPAAARTTQGIPDLDPEEFTNLAKWTLDVDGVERLKDEVSRVVAEQGLSPKKKITWDETRALAKQLGVNPEALSNIAGRMNGAELLAVRNIINQNIEQLVAIERAVASGTASDDMLAEMAEIRGALESQNDAMLGRMVKERSRAGRDLNNLRIIAESTMDPVFWLVRAKKMLGDEPLTDETRALILSHINTGNKAQLAQTVASLKKVSVASKLITLWKAGLLTGPPTHMANVIGNTAMAGLETAKDAPAALVDALLGIITGRRTKAGPAWSTVAASARGAKIGAKEAYRVLRTGASSSALAKWDMHKGETQFNNVVLDTYTRAVFRSLAASDRVFRAIAIQRSLDEQARVIARREGLKGSARKMRREQLAAAPTDQMALQAIADADIATFQDNSMLAQAASAVRRPFGDAGDFILPFTRTPGNVASRAAEYSPIGAAAAAAELLIKATRGQVDAKLQRKIAERIGRSATGTGAIAVGFYLAAQGKMLAGRPTPGSSKADQFDLEGKQGNAVLIDGQWMSVQRISPIGNLLALGAHLHAAVNDPETTKPGVALRGVTALGQTVYEQSFLRGLQDITGAVTDRQGGTERWLESTARSVVPAVVGRVAQGVDPVVREVEGPLEAIQARIPGLSDNLPARVDQLGQPQRRDGGFAGALMDPTNARRDKTQTDPLVAELARVGVTITRPKKRKGETARGREQRALEDGGDLEAQLLEAIESPEYLELPEIAWELVETEPQYAGRSARELARELQRDFLQDVVRQTRSAFARERRETLTP